MFRPRLCAFNAIYYLHLYRSLYSKSQPRCSEPETDRHQSVFPKWYRHKPGDIGWLSFPEDVASVVVAVGDRLLSGYPASTGLRRLRLPRREDIFLEVIPVSADVGRRKHVSRDRSTYIPTDQSLVEIGLILFRQT